MYIIQNAKIKLPTFEAKFVLNNFLYFNGNYTKKSETVWRVGGTGTAAPVLATGRRKSVHLSIYHSIIPYPANIVLLRHSLASLEWQVHLHSL